MEIRGRMRWILAEEIERTWGFLVVKVHWLLKFNVTGSDDPKFFWTLKAPKFSQKPSEIGQLTLSLSLNLIENLSVTRKQKKKFKVRYESTSPITSKLINSKNNNQPTTFSILALFYWGWDCSGALIVLAVPIREWSERSLLQVHATDTWNCLQMVELWIFLVENE